MSNEPLLLVLSGPSGVGKDSILERLRELGRPFHYTVTSTTRPPREGEVHGVGLLFLSPGEFEALRNQNGLIESACVYGRWYGVPKQPVVDALAAGKDVIMRTNVEGALSIKCAAPGAILIFVTAPSPEVLERRLRERRTDSADEIARRLAHLHEEMGAISSFDYVVVNDEGRLDDCVAAIEAIVLAEKCRVSRPALGLA